MNNLDEQRVCLTGDEIHAQITKDFACNTFDVRNVRSKREKGIVGRVNLMIERKKLLKVRTRLFKEMKIIISAPETIYTKDELMKIDKNFDDINTRLDEIKENLKFKFIR